MLDSWVGISGGVELAGIAWRLGAATLLGGLIGMEREWSGKAAGLRTHMTVSLASAAFVLTVIQIGGADEDVSRVLQGIAAGIGFLGAGTILKKTSEEEIQGLTTAATIFLTAAVGAAAGAGVVAIAVVCVIGAWLILTIMSAVERLIGGR